MDCEKLSARLLEGCDVEDFKTSAWTFNGRRIICAVVNTEYGSKRGCFIVSKTASALIRDIIPTAAKILIYSRLMKATHSRAMKVVVGSDSNLEMTKVLVEFWDQHISKHC